MEIVTGRLPVDESQPQVRPTELQINYVSDCDRWYDQRMHRLKI